MGVKRRVLQRPPALRRGGDEPVHTRPAAGRPDRHAGVGGRRGAAEVRERNAAGLGSRERGEDRHFGLEEATGPPLGRAAAMILPKVRDPRFITIRRGGTLTDSDHRLLALWAASCAEHVLHLFESAQPSDLRPRQAIAQARAWVRGEITVSQAREAAGHANGAARELSGAARHAAYAAAQAAAVAHVAAHELGSAAYAIKAARAAAPDGEGENSGRLECRWQRDQLPDAIRELVLDDQRLRNDICWSVFD